MKKTPTQIWRPSKATIAAPWSDWMNLRSNLAWIYEGPVSPENRQGPYNPDHLGAWLIIQGRATLKQPGQTTTAHAGQWLIPWPGFRHQEFSDDARILSIRFNAHWPDNKPIFEHGLSATINAAKFPALEQRARELLLAAQQVIPDNRNHISSAPIPFEAFIDVKIALFHWIREFYLTLCRHGLQPSRVGISDERIAKTLQTLDNLPLSARLLESKLASSSNLGVSQFVRIFRKELGETPKQYFDKRRYEYCRQMLRNPSVPIKEVACNLGFSRLSDFSAWVKHTFKLPPRALRQHLSETRPNETGNSSDLDDSPND